MISESTSSAELHTATERSIAFTAVPQHSNRTRGTSEPGIPPLGTLRLEACGTQLASRVFYVVVYINLSDVLFLATAGFYRLFWGCSWSKPVRKHYDKKHRG